MELTIGLVSKNSDFEDITLGRLAAIHVARPCVKTIILAIFYRF